MGPITAARFTATLSNPNPSDRVSSESKSTTIACLAGPPKSPKTPRTAAIMKKRKRSSTIPIKILPIPLEIKPKRSIDRRPYLSVNAPPAALPIMLPPANIENKIPTSISVTPKCMRRYIEKNGNNKNPPNLSMKVANTSTINEFGYFFPFELPIVSITGSQKNIVYELLILKNTTLHIDNGKLNNCKLINFKLNIIFIE